MTSAQPLPLPPIETAEQLAVATRERIQRHIAYELATIVASGQHTQQSLADLMGVDPPIVAKLLAPDRYENRTFDLLWANRLDEAGHRPFPPETTFPLLAQRLQEARTAEKPVRAGVGARYFLASPMDSSGDYGAENQAAREFAEVLHRYCGADVFYAGQTFGTPLEFDPEALAYAINLENLRKSSRFILLMTEPTIKPSSVWVDAGLALALKIPTTFIVEQMSWLPYILQRAHEQAAVQLEFGGREKAERLIRSHHEAYFR